MTDASTPALWLAKFKLRYRLEVVKRIVRRSRLSDRSPSVAVVYVYPLVGETAHDASAQRFVDSYRQFPPEYHHALHVVFNGGEPSQENLAVFDGLDAEFHRHDNSGWDIGAFQLLARKVECDLLVCLGSNSHFKRAGWLRRMADSWAGHGDALYGASASFERDPHVRTTAFWCDPMLIRAYPKRVRTFEDRYEFEASRQSITRCAEGVGLYAWLVTWDGEYSKREWRVPPNIFRRGDQSNSLVYDRYFELYESMADEERALHAELADAHDAGDSDVGIVFGESAGAHRWCKGKGVEIGASAHNPFGLDTLNVDIADDGEGRAEQMRMCGRVVTVDVLAPGDDLPFADESQDFVVSSHVLEHFPDPIAALLEWHRVTRPGGTIYMIVPHKERTFDRDRERTSLEHLIIDHEQGTVSESEWGHEHVWITEDVVELVEWMARDLDVDWRVAEVQDTDDKAGNGFAIALVKGGSMSTDTARVGAGS